VHAARKDLKRARAVLRLLRPVLDDRIYRRENAVLRNAAHTLNAARDAKMLTETLQSLRLNIPVLRRAPAVAELLATLQAQQARVQQRFRRHPAEMVRTQHALMQLCGRAHDWHVGRHGWSVLGPALKRVYEGGRRTLQNEREHPSDESLHTFRKQVKYVRYALEMLKPAHPRKLARLAREAERLTDTLGEMHDLVVLAHKAREFAKRNGVDLEPLLTIVDRQRTRLAVESLRTGGNFFKAKPGDWERRLSR